MAFDKVFAGPPIDEAAPGTKQSPSLAIDVSNKNLYISAGNGWEEISGGGGGTIDEPTSIQAHASIGVGSVVDPPYNANFDGQEPVGNILALKESIPGTNTDGVGGLYVEIDWTPTVTQPDGAGTQGIGVAVVSNMDGQATDNTSAWGIYGSAIATGNTRKYSQLVGVVGEVDFYGNADIQHLFGIQSNCLKGGSGTVVEDMIGIISSVDVFDSSHVPGCWSFYADPLVISGTALVDQWVGLHLHAPINSSSHPIGVAKGIQIDIATTAGTAARAIDSTGNALSDFAGPVAVPTLRAHTVYSAAGTALPSAATEGVGARAFVSDATASTFGTAYTGGGANKVPVWSDGTSWKIG